MRTESLNVLQTILVTIIKTASVLPSDCVCVCVRVGIILLPEHSEGKVGKAFYSETGRREAEIAWAGGPIGANHNRLPEENHMSSTVPLFIHIYTPTQP